MFIVEGEMQLTFNTMKRAIVKNSEILKQFIGDLKKQNTQNIEKNLIFIKKALDIVRRCGKIMDVGE